MRGTVGAARRYFGRDDGPRQYARIVMKMQGTRRHKNAGPAPRRVLAPLDTHARTGSTEERVWPPGRRDTGRSSAKTINSPKAHDGLAMHAGAAPEPCKEGVENHGRRSAAKTPPGSKLHVRIHGAWPGNVMTALCPAKSRQNNEAENDTQFASQKRTSRHLAWFF